MSVKLRCWSEDGEEVIDVPGAALAAQVEQAAAQHATDVPQPPAEFTKWTMPDDPDRYADFA
ncbi:hypothetical protein CupriaWKF_20240 [Cupriavidus sp. WKF15]|uniref:hypothetical protein n=1 Tax=Cupriavidus sp. WKF15 TaxID=3032282 RepID=UPI0023E10A14|nr:hypothetical protein [Cupriavidus sp. WKF15]WER49478.1 hypothetical protein CupriaWKF_20240 [Cupriavidus sp. WKF15]